MYNDHVELGGNMTLSEVIELFLKISSENPLMFGYLEVLADHIDLVAHISVRNVNKFFIVM